jgi:signal transduction histidine kinase
VNNIDIYVWLLVGIVLGVVILISLSVRNYVLHKRKNIELEDAKTEFLSLAAHYFMTPLAIIRGNISELMTPEASAWSKTQVQSRYLNIETSSTRLLLLLQNIMIISAIDQGSLKISSSPYSLIDIIDECMTSLHSLATKTQISMAFNRPDGADYTMTKVDREKIHQSIVNIIDNAIKFTKPGGTIKLSLTAEENKYRIDIADSGIGISSKEIQNLFTRFHRGTSYLNFDYEGVGLGLYIAKYLIEANGGRIYVSSEKNRGTCVTILLPK